MKDNNKLKVLLVSPYSENLVGGIANWTKYIVNYHRANGGDVDLRLLNNANATGLSNLGSIFQRIRYGFGNYLPVLRQFKSMVKAEHFDVVHISTSASFGLIRDIILARAARRKGIKVCVHMHFGRIPSLLKEKNFESRMLRCLLKRIDRVIVMDKASLEALIAQDYEQVSFLPNPLSTEVQELIERCKVTERVERKVVYAGHVCPTKGVLELVEACRDIEGVKLEVLGRETVPGTVGKMRVIAGENSERWLEILGNRPMSEVIEAMKTCAVFSLPSYSEGFPNVILESMACGCPIVATSVGAIAEMLDVDGQAPCGVCVPAKDAKSLHRAIADLLDNPDNAIQMGWRAKRRVYAEYEIRKVWKQLVEIWAVA